MQFYNWAPVFVYLLYYVVYCIKLYFFVVNLLLFSLNHLSSQNHIIMNTISNEEPTFWLTKNLKTGMATLASYEESVCQFA